MRHHDSRRKFHRQKRQRVALMRGLAQSLVLHDRIVTTLAKAKELRPYVEELVTMSKKGSLSSRRAVLRKIGSPPATRKLHEDIAKRYGSRAGGYTRITRLGRIGKRVSEQARIEFVN